MKVLLLTKYARLGASTRLRSLQYVAALDGMDVKFDMSPLFGDDYIRNLYSKKKISPMYVLHAYWARFLSLLQAKQYDVVWLEKELFPYFPSWFERALSQLRIQYIVDYDDAVFHNYDCAANPVKRLFKNKIAHVMRYAAMVIVGNNYLEDYAKRAGATRVERLPTVIDLQSYSAHLENSTTTDHAVIGWIGTPTTVRYLEPIFPVINRLSHIFDIELVLIGAEPLTKGYKFIRCINWEEATEVREIAKFDIGIMPLPDEPFEHGKCGYKLIQYMACYKPVVASPIGVNVDLVKHGENGFLADTQDSWFNALRCLITAPHLRAFMGKEGRSLVEEKYCLQVTAPKMLNLLREVAGRKARMHDEVEESRLQ